jgi:PAS domain S-box-containing protein
MTEGAAVSWSGRRAVVTFPAEVGRQNAARIGEELVAALEQGAAVLIADMSATVRCDQAGADAVARAQLRAAAGQVELRLVITAPDVRQLMSAQGLDRLVLVYPSLDAALADETAGGPDPAVADRRVFPSRRGGDSLGGGYPGSRDAPLLDGAVLRQLLDALDDGIVLADANGTIVLANRRLAAMFGFQPADLVGQPLEELVPPGLREAHRGYRAGYERKPVARPMADRARLAGLRRDGTTVPVTITLAPVPTAEGHLVLAIVRNATHAQQRDDLIVLLSSLHASQAERSRELLDRVVARLLHAGLSLEAAVSLPADVARERISDALKHLDDTIHEIRNHILDSGPPDTGH